MPPAPHQYKVPRSFIFLKLFNPNFCCINTYDGVDGVELLSSGYCVDLVAPSSNIERMQQFSLSSKAWIISEIVNNSSYLNSLLQLLGYIMLFYVVCLVSHGALLGRSGQSRSGHSPCVGPSFCFYVLFSRQPGIINID